MIRIDPWAYLLGAFLILTLPLDWLIAALFSALLHEISHLACVQLCGGHIWNIRIGVVGTCIEATLSDKRKELLCVLAGPAGSLLLLLCCHVFPKFAICAGVQGLFNLLPVSSLDGGRALRCALGLLCPGKAEKIGRVIEYTCLLILILLSAAGCFLYCLGAAPFICALVLIVNMILRKSPCKRSQIGVQ